MTVSNSISLIPSMLVLEARLMAVISDGRVLAFVMHLTVRPRSRRYVAAADCFRLGTKLFAILGTFVAESKPS
jgi:hypothetical protein